MKDPSDELITAIYTALNTNVSYGGKTIGVYTRMIEYEDLGADQYIRIDEIRFSENGPKDANISEGSLDLYIETFFTGKNEGSKKPVNNISNQVTQLIDQALDMTNFTMIVGRVSELQDLTYDLDPQGVLISKLITFSFTIQELPAE